MASKIQDDLSHIKNMMERSTRFISLSGLSGVLAGTVALVGAYIAHFMLQVNQNQPNTYSVFSFVMLALVVLVVAISAGVYFTVSKSKKLQLPFWTSASKNVLIALAVPLVTGGIFCLSLLAHKLFWLLVPVMLLFYGLALVNAEKYTFSDIKYLGFCQIVLGLIAAFVTNYALVFWALGFGVLHILYGIILYKKYN
ncbi:hypothetical protein K5I29_13305 [Flavobacterium agricola]|uniref:Uncharacterized protein n=1 Tax=Flavobacterium agricola TaxID=2870839 RepID=A0ABY6M2L5_9FLAO|nr:hypothetical protein [Flavobacterium agricola]UYW01386.1 hypothetical protein K5I29_13305 [Flavobacterium agricola]